MPENSSLRKTFSTSRFAIMLPAVARRSPASTTPPSQTAATIVGACGRSRMAWDPDLGMLGSGSPGDAGITRPGSRPGECEARKSVNEEVCRPRKPDGVPPEAPCPRPDAPWPQPNEPGWLPSKYEPNADLLP